MALIIKRKADDSVIGTAWSDLIFSGAGDDTVNGGAGADLVFTGAGNDVAIFNLSENAANRWLWDTYNGGRGEDTLRIELTSEEWSDPEVQAEILAYYAFLETATGKKEFRFETLKLKVSNFEKLELWIDGQAVDPRIENVDLQDSASNETVVITSILGSLVVTGSGGDTITGNIGNDVIRSGSGDDSIYAGDGDDYVDAGSGNDTIVAGTGAGDDIYLGGAGNDLITYSSSETDLVIDLREEDRSQYTSSNFATYSTLGDLLSNPPKNGTPLPATTPTGYADGLATNVDALIGVERVLGGRANDLIHGNDEDNDLDGFEGNDTLFGYDGSDIIHGGIGLDVLNGGMGHDLLIGGADDDTIDGGTGYDSIILSGNSTDYSIRRASVSGYYLIEDIGGTGDGTDFITQIEELIFLDGTFGIWNFVGPIEIRLTNGDDIETGTDAPEEFYGLDGDDNLQGGRNEDVFIGGRGNDTLNGGGVNDPDNDDDANFQWDAVLYDAEYIEAENEGAMDLRGVSVNLATGNATDVFGDNDVLIEIERVYGTPLDDTLIGSDESEAFDPRGGNDYIDGGAGQDALHYHLDFGFYDGSASAITVTFTAEGQGTVIDTQGDTDIFFGIEVVRGTRLDDTFIGSDGTQQFRGYDGADYFDGGDGRDILNYRDSANYGGTAGITARLNLNSIIDPWGNTDQAFNIEEVWGTGVNDFLEGKADSDEILRGEAGNDSLFGDSGNDSLYGGVGQDSINGGMGHDYMNGGIGDDTLYGASGDDFMEGGPGADSFLFRPSEGNDTISDYEVGVDEIVFISGGITISSSSELDADGDGVLDTLISLSTGGSILFLGVNGLENPNDIL